MLSDSSYKEILEWRSVLPTTDIERSEVINILSMVMEVHFQKLKEFIMMNHLRYDQLLEKRRFTSLQLQKNPFDLLNDFTTGERLSELLQPPIGLIARIVQDCLLHQFYHHNSSSLIAGHSPPSSQILMKLLEHIENPLQHLAKQGLGLLSRGLGRYECMKDTEDIFYCFRKLNLSLVFSFCVRLGFGGDQDESSAEHPAMNDVIIIFVLGGISPKEVGQVQTILKEQPSSANSRIILLSNHLVSAEEVLQSIF